MGFVLVENSTDFDQDVVQRSKFIHTITELALVNDDQLIDLALTHRSFAYENGNVANNERLEFLGDSILGVIVTERLYTSFPDLSEGSLAKIRAAVVNSRALAEVARSLEIGSLVKLGKGELSSGGRDKHSILADTMEALIGAVHLTNGIAGSTKFVREIFDPVIEEAAQLGAGLDWKTSIQELAVQIGAGNVRYEVTAEGPDHAKSFTAWLLVDDRKLGPGTGNSKKEAEQMAAQIAFEEISAQFFPETT